MSFGFCFISASQVLFFFFLSVYHQAWLFMWAPWIKFCPHTCIETLCQWSYLFTSKVSFYCKKPWAFHHLCLTYFNHDSQALAAVWCDDSGKIASTCCRHILTVRCYQVLLYPILCFGFQFELIVICHVQCGSAPLPDLVHGTKEWKNDPHTNRKAG